MAKRELTEEECLHVVLGHIQEMRVERDQLWKRHRFLWEAKRDQRIAALNRKIEEWEEVRDLILSKL